MSRIIKYNVPFHSVELSEIKKMNGSVIVSVSRSAVNYCIIELMDKNDANSKKKIDALHKATATMVDSERNKRNTSRFEITASEVSKIFGNIKALPSNSFLVKEVDS